MLRCARTTVLAATWLLGCAASCNPPPLDLELRIDDRYVAAVDFGPLGLVVPLAGDRYVRSAGSVDDLDANQSAMLRDVGLDPQQVTFVYLNPATNGRTFALRFRNGPHVAFVAVRRRDDARVTAAALAHESYHALASLDPALLPRVHRRVRELGFAVDWQDHDEELRATLVEVAALRCQGIPLTAISGSELIVRARDLLLAAAVDRDAARPR